MMLYCWYKIKREGDHRGKVVAKIPNSDLLLLQIYFEIHVLYCRILVIFAIVFSDVLIVILKPV